MSIESNWCSCTKCHAGYGWEDSSFDFTDRLNIDCLVCHDTTGKYSKNKCGYPNKDIDFTEIAKNVGNPGRSNCGACHWYGGGGDNIKHGNLNSELANPSPSFDVHMGGNDFTCQECHVTDKHIIAGKSLALAVGNGEVSCIDCHDEKPHDNSAPLLKKLNEHCSSISCQTCHIAKFARKKFTLTYRDWSKGDGKTKILKQTENRIEMYHKSGLLIKEKNLTPQYAWYNGKQTRYLKGDPGNLGGVTVFNPPEGSITDPSAKITPFKFMKSMQPADAENGQIIVPNLIGKDGFYATRDWKQTAELGMKAAGLKFSGKVAFAETLLYRRINHGVTPKEDALSCLDCHSPSGVMDFKALGYKGDPAETGARFDE
ncbi:MAG: tetrathionate reductase family octaheme c-type cytochrome [Thermodesulfobacteriota bacterium]|nr:tetrathionate reductase family octaheme c-type cytochrome [Thermodesulfobacteriota bacterium]